MRCHSRDVKFPSLCVFESAPNGHREEMLIRLLTDNRVIAALFLALCVVNAVLIKEGQYA